VTVKGFPVCPERIRRFKRFAVVEVAAMVTWWVTSAEVVPIDTMSVWVCRATSVPVSIHPPAEEGVAFQERVPDPSVCRKPEAVMEEGQV
jgi:hypothetical protein